MAEEKQPQTLSEDAQFQIQKVYTKDISFETPNTPTIFKEEWKPVVDLHMTNEATLVDLNKVGCFFANLNGHGNRKHHIVNMLFNQGCLVGHM